MPIRYESPCLGAAKSVSMPRLSRSGKPRAEITRKKTVPVSKILFAPHVPFPTVQADLKNCWRQRQRGYLPGNIRRDPCACTQIVHLTKATNQDDVATIYPTRGEPEPEPEPGTRTRTSNSGASSPALTVCSPYTTPHTPFPAIHRSSI